jgi:hypothetical protein
MAFLTIVCNNLDVNGRNTANFFVHLCRRRNLLRRSLFDVMLLLSKWSCDNISLLFPYKVVLEQSQTIPAAAPMGKNLFSVTCRGATYLSSYLVCEGQVST